MQRATVHRADAAGLFKLAAAAAALAGLGAPDCSNQHVPDRPPERSSVNASSHTGEAAERPVERATSRAGGVPSTHLGVGGDVAEAGPTLPRSERRPCLIAAIGDSLTDVRSHGGGFLQVIQRLSPQSRIDNYGRGGDMVNQMRRRFFAEVVAPSAPSYSHVIVFGGVNDLYSDLTANRTNDRIQRDLLAMYQAARERGAEVIAITVTPWGGFSRYFNERRRRATHALNDWIMGQAPGPLALDDPGPGDGRGADHVVDGFSLLSCGDRDRLCDRYAAPFKDGLHFGPAGHQVLGAAIHEAALSDCL